MQENIPFFKKIIPFLNTYKIYIISIVIVVVLGFFADFSRENPTSFEGMVKKAENYYEKGQIAFALEEYKKIIRLYPKNYDVHRKLAELYKQLNEPEKAKAENIRAISAAPPYRYEAILALAKIYINEKRFDIAEDLIKNIKKTNRPELLKELGDIYYAAGEFYSAGDRLEAIRKFKKAYDFYKKAQNSLKNKALMKIHTLYAEIADTLASHNQNKEAENILNLSIEYKDNALAHYKLAKIYEKNSLAEKALKEYSKAFKMDSNIGNINSYAALLLKEAENFDKKGEKIKAELYRLKAKKINKKLDVPDNPDKKILFRLIAIKINEDIERDTLRPGIIFNITNITDKILNKIKVKVIFYEGNKPFNTKIISIANEEFPLKGDARTSDVSVYSDKFINHVFDEHDLWAKVYISQQEPDEWELFRNIPIMKEKRSILIKK